MQGSEIVDILTQRAVSFEMKGRTWHLYPQTLGQTLLIGDVVKQLGVNVELLTTAPMAEFLRLADAENAKVSRIIAYALAHGDEAINNNFVVNVTEEIMCADVADRATLLQYIFSADNTNAYVKHYKIDAELEEMKRIKHLQETPDTSISFCGLSPLGGIIDWAMERYGWTYDYVLWGISNSVLQLLFADNVKTMYLDDKQRKYARKRTGENIDLNKITISEFKRRGYGQ